MTKKLKWTPLFGVSFQMVVIAMKTIDLLEQYASLIKEKVNDYVFKISHRTDPKDFTRNSKLGFAAVLLIMLNFKTKSNALSVYNFAAATESIELVSRQAYEAARDKVKSSAFAEIFDDGVRLALLVDDHETFCGFRLCAIDGSTATMPESDALAEAYGPTTPVPGKTYARISFCADVLNGIILDGKIVNYSIGERRLALEHVKKGDDPGRLYLFDRGYWDPKLISAMLAKSQSFLMRVARNAVKAIVESESDSGDFVFKHEGDERTLRYYKFELQSGEMEYLVTNVGREVIPDSKLPELYHYRWGVETRYDELKNRMQFGAFSGKTVNTIEQEFYATLVVMNMTAFAIAAADVEVKSSRKSKDNKHTYKPNGNMAAGILKDRLIKAIIADDPKIREKMLDKLIHDISKHVVPVRPDRHYPRDMPNNRRKKRKRNGPL